MSISRKLLSRLNQFRGCKTVIVGIGNTLKADDGVGPFICHQLEGKVCADIIDTGTVPENYIQPVIEKSPDKLLVIDAIDFKAAPGTVEIFAPEHLSSLVISTHSLSPRLFVDLICRDTDIDVHFIGIQPAHIRIGQSLSPEVLKSAELVVEVLTQIFRCS